MELFGLVIVRASELPHIKKAHKLARTLTERQIDDIMTGASHLHRNPRKRKEKVISE